MDRGDGIFLGLGADGQRGLAVARLLGAKPDSHGFGVGVRNSRHRNGLTALDLSQDAKAEIVKGADGIVNRFRQFLLPLPGQNAVLASSPEFQALPVIIEAIFQIPSCLPPHLDSSR